MSTGGIGRIAGSERDRGFTGISGVMLGRTSDRNNYRGVHLEKSGSSMHLRMLLRGGRWGGDIEKRHVEEKCCLNDLGEERQSGHRNRRIAEDGCEKNRAEGNALM